MAGDELDIAAAPVAPERQTAKPPVRRPKGRYRRVARRLGIVALAVLIVLGGSSYFFVQRTLPTVDGVVRATGLEARVEVERDRWGVPHIYAQSMHDVYFAQGYVAAQDRLWQMELFRRTGQGTLSEIFGKVTLDTDLFVRTIGMRRVAEQEAQALDVESRSALEAYAAGVNAFVDTHRDRLPLEFTILGFQPAPWNIVDSVTWGKMMAWDLGGNWERELLRANLLARFGPDVVKELALPYGGDAPLIVPKGVDYGTLGSASNVPRLLSSAAGADAGSNSWVVDGTKSATGKPLLANDPHLGIQMPSLWYEVQLVVPASPTAAGLNVAGSSFAGVPGVIIGHNDRIAWGMTNLGPDVQDLYVEKLNPDNPHQYLFQGRWEDAQVFPQEITVKGEKEPVKRDVIVTRHGPLINGVVKGLGQPLALRWTALDATQSIVAVRQLNRARNWTDFRDALRDWSVPSQNFVYADVEGNIGYQAPGAIPIRAKGDGLLPAPGWTGEYEWISYVPFDKLPSVYNPARHYLVTANNKVVDDSYPYLLSYEWDAGYRARRIEALLAAKEKLNTDDFRAIQADLISEPDRELAALLVKIEPKNDLSRRAQQYLRDWDGSTTADSVAAAVVETTLSNLLRTVFANAMGDELFKKYLDQGPTAPIPALLAGIKNHSSEWWLSVRTPAQPSREEALRESLRQATEYLRQRFGDNPNDWRWGRLHTITFAHPLGAVPTLDRLFSFGPYEHGGSNFTINNGGFALNKPYAQKTVSSLRQVLDLGDLDRSLFVHTTGQSGQPFSNHVADLVGLWLRGDYHPMLFSRDGVNAQRQGHLVLTP